MMFYRIPADIRHLKSADCHLYTAVGSSADFQVIGPTHYNSHVTESDTDATPSV